MSWGPKGCADPPVLQCSTCGRNTELFELPGRRERYCFKCSADVATSLLLATEIDAATRSGEDTAGARGGVSAIGPATVGKSTVSTLKSRPTDLQACSKCAFPIWCLRQ